MELGLQERAAATVKHGLAGRTANKHLTSLLLPLVSSVASRTQKKLGPRRVQGPVGVAPAGQCPRYRAGEEGEGESGGHTEDSNTCGP